MTTTALIANNLPIPSALGSLDAYIAAVNRVPVLTVEDEQALARSYRDDEDLDAAKALVMSHLRFVVHVARGYQGYGLGMGDLIQEGNIGLMKAVKRFDPDQGVRLVSFAVHWVRAEMHEVLEMESRLSGRDIGFDAPDNGDDDAPPSPVAYLRDSGEDPAMAYERESHEDDQLELLREGLSGLDQRSRDILKRRFLGEPKATLQELADEYGVSAERIRQVEANALKKMRALFAA